MTTGRKLTLAGLVVAGVTGYMAFVGGSASWQYYVTPQECLQRAGELAGHRIRVSGKISAGSLHIAADRGQASFLLAGSSEDLPVSYSGTLPDNLAESMEVVVEGRLEGEKLLRGEKLITRCASKYKARQAANAEKTP